MRSRLPRNRRGVREGRPTGERLRDGLVRRPAGWDCERGYRAWVEPAWRSTCRRTAICRLELRKPAGSATGIRRGARPALPLRCQRMLSPGSEAGGKCDRRFPAEQRSATGSRFPQNGYLEASARVEMRARLQPARSVLHRFYKFRQRAHRKLRKTLECNHPIAARASGIRS